jgi:hypothetical protein
MGTTGARLADGVTVKNARAEMETIGKRLAQAYPATNQNYVPKASTFTEWFIGRTPSQSTVPCGELSVLCC